MLTAGTLLSAILTYGPSIIPVVSKLVTDIKAGGTNKEVTVADLAELQALADQSAADIYKRLGITPPPPAP